MIQNLPQIRGAKPHVVIGIRGQAGQGRGLAQSARDRRGEVAVRQRVVAVRALVAAAVATTQPITATAITTALNLDANAVIACTRTGAPPPTVTTREPQRTGTCRERCSFRSVN